MSITLDISEALMSELELEACRLGIPLGDYMVTLLATSRSTELQPKNGAGLVAYWREQGVVGVRPDIANSVAHADEVRGVAEHRFRG